MKRTQSRGPNANSITYGLACLPLLVSGPTSAASSHHQLGQRLPSLAAAPISPGGCTTCTKVLQRRGWLAEHGVPSERAPNGSLYLRTYGESALGGLCDELSELVSSAAGAP
jgi:hypothetical protein